MPQFLSFAPLGDPALSSQAKGEAPAVTFVFSLTRRRSIAGLLAGAGVLVAGCTQNSQYLSPNAVPTNAQTAPEATIGTGQVKVGLILPLSAPGNAGVAGQAMRNAAELALAEFNAPNVQILVKDDAGTPDGARAGAQQSIDQGAEIILGPLFAQSVTYVGQVARTRNIPVIAFSTDTNVAANGVYLLSFLPESDVDRIVQYTTSIGRHSFAALVPDNPYGTVVEAAFKQIVTRRGGQIVGLERYPHDKGAMAGPIQNIAQASADALFIPDGGDAVPGVVAALAADGVNLKRMQLLGTGLWDDPRIYATPALDGGFYAAPDGAGFRNFTQRYHKRYGQDPVRTATLAYDAVALVAALVKTQGPGRFSQETLTNPSGFTGIDGLFRFRADGTSDRGLAVMRVTPGGPQIVSPAPKSFGVSPAG
jgi:branched-chain amino acid transport system substrate-binding protein